MTREVHTLARLYGVESSYRDGLGNLRRPEPDKLLPVFRALGAPVERVADCADAVRARLKLLWNRPLEPALVAWEGSLRKLRLRLPLELAEEPIGYEIDLESGERRAGRLAWSPRVAAKEIDGARYIARSTSLPERLPPGYHRLRVQIRDKTFESLIVSAPLLAYSFPEGKRWGIFLPLYALRSQRSWGAGDFTDLETLARWTKSLGGDILSTLPLLPTFLEEPFEPSPYSPVSRLFWSEFYIDLGRVPGISRCQAAQGLLNSSQFKNDLETLRSLPLVNYRRVMALKRRVLTDLASSFFDGHSERQESLRSFLEARPEVEDYACFRAAADKERKPWTDWPAPARDGVIRDGEYSEELKRYHLFAQWAAHEQIKAVSKSNGAALYLDLPLGVHPAGYDTWRERGSFAFGVSGGAPPDNFFVRGQNWGFPPLHPERIREARYRYFIACLRHHLKCSSLLRIDHVMGFHRLFWIPDGLEAQDGVYVHYRAEEFYAILSLESHRHQALIIGENLGTVPAYVNTTMAAHGIRGMVIGQFGVRPDPETALEDVPPTAVASLNTHDTPTFASFWAERDIEDRIQLGLLDEASAARERKARDAQRKALIAFLKQRDLLEGDSPKAEAVLKAWLVYLGSSPAGTVLVNLEDLWLETEPQNVPGTFEERPNWRRKARYGFEEFSQNGEILDILRALDNTRKRGKRHS